MRRTGILAIALAVMMALPAAAQTSTVQAGVYTDFRQLLSGEAPASTVGVTMTLRFPEEAGEDRHPAIVIAQRSAVIRRPMKAGTPRPFASRASLP